MVEDICPNVGPPKATSGSLNWGWLNALKNSVRNSRPKSSLFEEPELFEQGNVPVVLTRAGKDADTGVPETERGRIIGAKHRGSGKTSCVDVVRKVRADTAGSDVVPGLACPGKAGSIVVGAEYIGAVCKADREMASRLDGRDAGDRPTAECLPRESIVFEWRGKVVGEVNDEAVLTDELVRTVALGGIVLVADRDATVRTGAGSGVGGEIFGKSVGSLELEAATELLRDADQEGVVPGSPARFDLLHVRRIPALEGNAQRNIRHRVGGLAADWICGAGKIRLIDRALANEMKSAGSGIAYFENQTTREFGLQTETILLRKRRPEVWVKDGNGIVGCQGNRERRRETSEHLGQRGPDCSRRHFRDRPAGGFAQRAEQ